MRVFAAILFTLPRTYLQNKRAIPRKEGPFDANRWGRAQGIWEHFSGCFPSSSTDSSDGGR